MSARACGKRRHALILAWLAEGVIDGVRVDHFPSSLARLERVKPVYETLPGWNADTTGITDAKDLPVNARKYLDRLAELVDVPVGMLSLGPKRHQTIRMGM